MSLGRVCISTKSNKQISVTIKVKVNGELFDVNVLEFGTWNTNITDTASDVLSQMEANHLDKVDTLVEDKENDDLDDIDGNMKDLDNDAKNKENVFVSPKEVVPDQPIKQVEEDILKQPEEECIKVSKSSDLSRPPGFENTKKTLSNNSKCSTNFARHHKKDIKGISLIHELNKIIKVGTTLGYDFKGCKKSLNRMINGIECKNKKCLVLNYFDLSLYGEISTLITLVAWLEVKDKQEKDKIGTKPDKNEKRGKAQRCQKSVTVEKA
nr:RNA-directed DNA polymerase, eukaryota [Tanacetum cinerariifolium]